MVTNTLHDTLRIQMKFNIQVCGSKPCAFFFTPKPESKGQFQLRSEYKMDSKNKKVVRHSSPT